MIDLEAKTLNIHPTSTDLFNLRKKNSSSNISHGSLRNPNTFDASALDTRVEIKLLKSGWRAVWHRMQMRLVGETRKSRWSWSLVRCFWLYVASSRAREDGKEETVNRRKPLKRRSVLKKRWDDLYLVTHVQSQLSHHHHTLVFLQMGAISKHQQRDFRKTFWFSSLRLLNFQGCQQSMLLASCSIGTTLALLYHSSMTFSCRTQVNDWW